MEEQAGEVKGAEPHKHSLWHHKKKGELITIPPDATAKGPVGERDTDLRFGDYEKLLEVAGRASHSSGDLELLGMKGSWRRHADGTLGITYIDEEGNTHNEDIKKRKDGGIEVKSEKKDNGDGQRGDHTYEGKTRIFDREGNLQSEERHVIFEDNSHSYYSARKIEITSQKTRNGDGTYSYHEVEKNEDKDGNSTRTESKIELNADGSQKSGKRTITHQDGSVETQHLAKNEDGVLDWVPDDSEEKKLRVTAPKMAAALAAFGAQDVSEMRHHGPLKLDLLGTDQALHAVGMNVDDSMRVSHQHDEKKLQLEDVRSLLATIDIKQDGQYMVRSADGEDLTKSLRINPEAIREAVRDNIRHIDIQQEDHRAEQYSTLTFRPTDSPGSKEPHVRGAEK